MSIYIFFESLISQVKGIYLYFYPLISPVVNIYICWSLYLKFCSLYISSFYIFSYFFRKINLLFLNKNYLTWTVEKIENLATIKFSHNITNYFNHKTLIHINELIYLYLFNVCIQIQETPNPIFCGNYLYVFFRIQYKR